MEYICMLMYPRKIKYHLLVINEYEHKILWQHVVLTCNLLLFGLDEM